MMPRGWDGPNRILKYWCFLHSQLAELTESQVIITVANPDEQRKEGRVYWITDPRKVDLYCILHYPLWRKYERAGSLLFAREMYQRLRDTKDLAMMQTLIASVREIQGEFGFSDAEIAAGYTPPRIVAWDDDENVYVDPDYEAGGSRDLVREDKNEA